MAQRVTIRSRDRAAMSDLVVRYQIDIAGKSDGGDERGGYHVDALVDEKKASELEAAGYTIEVLDPDVEETVAKRRAEIDWHDDDRPGRGPRRGPR